MVEDVREEGLAGATVGVQKTEQIQLVRRDEVPKLVHRLGPWWCSDAFAGVHG